MCSVREHPSNSWRHRVTVRRRHRSQRCPSPACRFRPSRKRGVISAVAGAAHGEFGECRYARKRGCESDLSKEMSFGIVDALEEFDGIRAKALTCTVESCAEAGCGGQKRF